MIESNLYKASKWISYPKPNREARLKLFCFPYAGSSGIVTYKHFADNLIDDIEICPIELPGRGFRLIEPLLDNIHEIVNQLHPEILPHLNKQFAFFGHSMGALISFELAKKLSKENGKVPGILYVSAHRAPNISERQIIFHTLAYDDLLIQLKKNNGMMDEVLNNKELLELVLPIIKNDYKVCETYKLETDTKLDCPITAFGGKQDSDVNEEHLKGWANFTNLAFNLKIFDGDHFFIIKERKSFLKIFNEQIQIDLLNLVR